LIFRTSHLVIPRGLLVRGFLLPAYHSLWMTFVHFQSMRPERCRKSCREFVASWEETLSWTCRKDQPSPENQ